MGVLLEFTLHDNLTAISDIAYVIIRHGGGQKDIFLIIFVPERKFNDEIPGWWSVSLSAITGTTFVEPRRKTFCNTVDFGINRPQRS